MCFHIYLICMYLNNIYNISHIPLTGSRKKQNDDTVPQQLYYPIFYLDTFGLKKEKKSSNFASKK